MTKLILAIALLPPIETRPRPACAGSRNMEKRSVSLELLNHRIERSEELLLTGLGFATRLFEPLRRELIVCENGGSSHLMLS
ncbi:MAG: hypothetical protein AB8G77_24625 [Rhodothermales bacterium]